MMFVNVLFEACVNFSRACVKTSSCLLFTQTKTINLMFRGTVKPV